MKKYIVLLILLLATSCHDSRKIILDGTITYRKYSDWRQNFKDRVFCNCVLKGIGNKAITDTVYSIDRSFSNEIEIVFRKDISDILKPIVAQMKADSLASLTTVAEGAAGKHVFDTCIDFYKSRKLDSISREKLKKWKKMDLDSVMIQMGGKPVD